MAAPGRHRSSRKRFLVALLAAATLGGGSLVALDASAHPARAADGCVPNESTPMGKYWLNNNTWGAGSGSGWSCTWATYQSGNTIGWGTTHDWSGAPESVKSYASSVLGWHWGWKSGATGLPVRLSARTPVRAKWSYQVKETRPGAYNVSYDLWLHDRPDTDWQSRPKHEVMVWLAKGGGAMPLGTRQQRVKIAGAYWDLYAGRTDWNVYSFVRVGGTTASDLDLDDFLQALVRRGAVAPTDYLSGVEAGTEAFTGRAQLDTTAYEVQVG
ncbi:endo-1,4-beta-glucanase [Streptomyces sp. NPDC018019]|uniref:GH12 family glycosyl hydrolase domain-containing protein n=1 Tax=Streptomyces sp. NPDC018019 TaxID=3365030 RepID=UPI00378C870E